MVYLYNFIFSYLNFVLFLCLFVFSVYLLSLFYFVILLFCILNKFVVIAYLVIFMS